ncbi:hypothetical protein Gotri_028010 [Gossypium trilobum]|uniref:Uncharacterized protein n=1 Tax=Gossypium trilobum TaxID=34281 RepID=A0A7J9FMP3_9ROSI|nr:hypothetical protein [Gossypium trilobum]
MGDSLIEGYVLELWDFTRISYWNPAYSWKGGFGTYYGIVHDFAPLPEDSN